MGERPARVQNQALGTRQGPWRNSYEYDANGSEGARGRRARGDAPGATLYRESEARRCGWGGGGDYKMACESVQHRTGPWARVRDRGAIHLSMTRTPAAKARGGDAQGATRQRRRSIERAKLEDA